MSDLIDRDAYCEFVCMHDKNDCKQDKSRCSLFEIPAVDAEPVRHGMWVKCKEDALVHWDCSECGIGFLDDAGLEKLKYCPNCGAKMDGGST